MPMGGAVAEGGRGVRGGGGAGNKEFPWRRRTTLARAGRSWSLAPTSCWLSAAILLCAPPSAASPSSATIASRVTWAARWEGWRCTAASCAHVRRHAGTHRTTGGLGREDLS